jgi:Holliday junction DNA helicase RuvA
MFESVQGRLASKEPSRVVVETGGELGRIGWSVQVPLSDFDALPPIGREVRLLLHVEARDDGWRLFGFLRAEHREAFRRLLKVKGVGPLTAMTILSGIGVADLAAAIAEADTGRLGKVKGVGRKTADLIVAELREDARRGLLGPLPGGRPGGVPAVGPAADALMALVALGIDPQEARRRVDALGEQIASGAPVSEIVRAALRA